MVRRLAAAAALLGLLLVKAGPASAAGFAIYEHSAQGMGNAFAGGGAAAEDASSIWFNPASMSRLGSQFQVSAHLLRPAFKFTDSGSTSATGAPLLSGAGGTAPAPLGDDAGEDAFVPNIYYVRQLNERVAFGLAINAPFGLATKYDENWMGRYQSIDSEIIDVNVNPALSFKVHDQFTVGAGININYIDAKLTRAIDFTGQCLASAGPAAAFCTGAAAGPGQGANDGQAKITGDDISFGFNLGLMYELTENTRFSVAYRSQINHKLDGKGQFRVPVSINAVPAVDAALRAPFAPDGVSAGVSLPDTLSFSAYHRFHPQFALMGDATWTSWSDVQQLLIVFDNPATAGGPSAEPLGWRNTWRLALGLNYYASQDLTLRTGIAYDQSPIPSAALLTPRLPDNDRTWVSIGASYRFNDAVSADVGYSHLFLDDTLINRTDANGTLRGTYENDADIFSAQLSYRFD